MLSIKAEEYVEKKLFLKNVWDAYINSKTFIVFLTLEIFLAGSEALLMKSGLFDRRKRRKRQ